MTSRFFFFILLLALPVWLAAQRLDQFSDNQGEYLAQLKTFMTESKQPAMEATYKAYEAAFAGGAFPEEDFLQIVSTSNTMLSLRMGASPYFKSYLDLLVAIKKSDNAAQRFKDIHRILNAMLAEPERRANDYLVFLNFMANFLENRVMRQAELGSSWYILSDAYRLRYEDRKPMVVVEKADLMASRKNDSIFIYQTSGILYPLENRWRGIGGKVTWERRGLGRDVYAEFADYELDVSRSLYEVPKVKFYYPLFFGAQAVEGSFSDKLIAGEDVTAGSYPRFESAKPVSQLGTLGKGLVFYGWFRMQGATVYGFGQRDNPAQIQIVNEQKQVLYRGAAENFSIKREELITAERVNSSVYFGKDSIFHPSVGIRYSIPLRQLELTRGQRGSDRNPFFSSLHNVNIDVEKITAYFDKDSIYLGERNIANSFKKDVVFESLHFFRKADYQRIQSIASSNPLAVMKAVAKEPGVKVDASLLARSIDPKFSVENIQTLLYDLMAQGFVNYDSERQLVEVKEKVFHYVNSDAGKTDYDLLRILSKYYDGPNAALNMRNGAMTLQGVENIEFSARQRVALKPDNQAVTLRNDRNMDFDGRVFAGFSILEGKKFRFDYSKFQIGLDSVRFFDLFLPTGELDKNRNPIAYGINSRIEYLTGALLIDAPGNKSGRDNIVMFPSLESKAKSFVFYDKPETQQGAYKRDSFYFELAPFSFPHLDVLSSKDLVFKGRLVSADIFPPIAESITLQEDRSLGFISQTPPTGLPAYRAKGRYTGDIELSNKGLLGKGTLAYLAASVNAKDIVFKPDEMLAKADRFDLEEARTGQVKTPQVRGEQVAIQWRPYRDSMYVRSETAPFALFKENKHTLEGTLILTPGGLKGNGTLNWDKASLQSRLLSFGAFSSNADTSTVQIRTVGTEGVALRTSNVNSQVDFDQKIGQFKANKPGEWTYFPYNQYQTSLNEYTWDMQAETIRFKSEKGLKGKFRSLHPDQDSLTFEGETAYYDLKSSELRLGGVTSLIAADAFIYPDSGLVSIAAQGEMRPLENARIVADTLNRNHVINRATVHVRGKRYYQAEGYYEYNVSNRQQEIHFQNIVGQPVGKGKMSERPAVTRATGEVSPEMNFYIDHKTRFKGTITLNAESKALKFDGFAYLDADKLPYPEWFSVSSEADKSNLIIRYDVPKNENGDPLRTGLYLGKENAMVYPRVMQALPFRKDRDIFPARGFFRYDKAKDQFIFGDSARVFNAGFRGNLFTFKNTDGSVEADGRFNLGSALKYITVEAAGIARTTFPPPPANTNVMLDDEPGAAQAPVENPVRAELMLGVKMPLPEVLARIMLTDFRSSDFSANPISYLTDLDYYRRAATQLLPDDKDIREAISGMSSGYLDIPKRLNPYTFLFSRLKLKWDSEYQSFIGTENTAGLVSINGEGLNRVVTCYFECKMPSNEDDRLYIYLKSPSEQFYFFGYKQGVLNVASNNPAFMGALEGMKAKDRIIKMPDGENLEIAPLEESEGMRFVRRIQAAKK